MRISDWSSDVCSSDLGLQAGTQVVLDLVPGPLVLRLFLAPHHFPGRSMALEFGDQLLARERIQLFHADQGDVLDLLLAGFLEQVVIDLARAPDPALDLLRGGGGDRKRTRLNSSH